MQMDRPTSMTDHDQPDASALPSVPYRVLRDHHSNTVSVVTTLDLHWCSRQLVLTTSKSPFASGIRCQAVAVSLSACGRLRRFSGRDFVRQLASDLTARGSAVSLTAMHLACLRDLPRLLDEVAGHYREAA